MIPKQAKFPGLNPTAPQEPQAHRLKILTEIEACFLDRN